MPVSNISIIKSAPYAGGQRFGKIGSYTEVDLTVNFEIGPDDYAHQVIADLPLCKESDQIVRFSSDAKILIPENCITFVNSLHFEIAYAKRIFYVKT